MHGTWMAYRLFFGRTVMIMTPHRVIAEQDFRSRGVCHPDYCGLLYTTESVPHFNVAEAVAVRCQLPTYRLKVENHFTGDCMLIAHVSMEAHSNVRTCRTRRAER